MFSIKEIIEHFRKERCLEIGELASCIGLNKRTLYNRYSNPSSWRLGELIDCYNFLKVPQEVRKFE